MELPPMAQNLATMRPSEKVAIRNRNQNLISIQPITTCCIISQNLSNIEYRTTGRKIGECVMSITSIINLESGWLKMTLT
jgi:hypothetical protein